MRSVTPSIESVVSAPAPGFRAWHRVESAPVADPAVAGAGAGRGLPGGAAGMMCPGASAPRHGMKCLRLGAGRRNVPPFGRRCAAGKEEPAGHRSGWWISTTRSAFATAVPVCGENSAAHRGEPRLAIACGDGFGPDTPKSAGAGSGISGKPGEVIWRDDIGVESSRRWNWRQACAPGWTAAQTMWFILESLPAMPLSALHEAGERLVVICSKGCPRLRVDNAAASR